MLSDVGSPVTVTASIAGTVNVTVCVCVIAESVVLVAVTVNESAVPGGGDRLAGVRLQVDAEDAGLTGRDRDAGAAVEEREAAGDVRERQVVSVGGRAEVLDRARKAVGSCAPLNGTVNSGSDATVNVMPGCVGVIVTSTVVWR